MKILLLYKFVHDTGSDNNPLPKFPPIPRMTEPRLCYVLDKDNKVTSLSPTEDWMKFLEFCSPKLVALKRVLGLRIGKAGKPIKGPWANGFDEKCIVWASWPLAQWLVLMVSQ